MRQPVPSGSILQEVVLMSSVFFDGSVDMDTPPFRLTISQIRLQIMWNPNDASEGHGKSHFSAIVIIVKGPIIPMSVSEDRISHVGSIFLNNL